MKCVVLLATLFSAAVCLVSATGQASAKDRLTRDLLNGYQPAVDPGNIELEFGLSFICASYEHKTGTVVSEVWEMHFWNDSRLSWTPSEYGGVETIRVPAKLIWTPDTRAYYTRSSVVERDDVNVAITSGGRVTWIPPATYRTRCQAGEEEVSCKLKIGSWTYDGYNVNLKPNGETPLDLTSYDEACPAVITSHTAEVVSHKYPCCEEPYPSFDVSFTLKSRKGKCPGAGKSEL